TVMITVIEPPVAAKRMRSASVIFPSGGSWAVGQVGAASGVAGTSGAAVVSGDALASGDAMASGETLPARFDEHAASAPIARQTPMWQGLRPIVPSVECLR